MRQRPTGKIISLNTNCIDKLFLNGSSSRSSEYQHGQKNACTPHVTHFVHCLKEIHIKFTTWDKPTLDADDENVCKTNYRATSAIATRLPGVNTTALSPRALKSGCR